MQINKNNKLQIGLIVGAGTGKDLTDIFKEFLGLIVKKHSTFQVEFITQNNPDGTQYIYHSYTSLIKEIQGDFKLSAAKSQEEVSHLLKTTKEWYKRGVRVVFRTAVNAETLYIFRQKVKAVKVFAIETLTGTRIIFIRDQAEGFYANKSYYSDGVKIKFNGVFSKDHHQMLVKYSIKFADEFFKSYKGYQKWAIYKFHLFGNHIEDWVKEIDEGITTCQPDTGLTNLNKIIAQDWQNSTPHNLLIICSNEVGDLIFETILGHINVGDEAKIDFYTRNYYTASPFHGDFVEYQTVHGSADDIEGTDRVFPYAVLRIAADIAEQYFGVKGIKDYLELSISSTKRKKLLNTSSILAEVYSQLKNFQNDTEYPQ